MQELGQASSYVEFGSGGSTVCADRAGIPTTSVENDRFYARAVASKLTSGHVRQIVVNNGITREWGFPIFPTKAKSRAYVSAPFNGRDFPDFILVDGRYRVACALESARQSAARKKSAVLMFDDYSTRPQYSRAEEFLGKPDMAGRAAVFTLGRSNIPIQAIEDSLTDRW